MFDQVKTWLATFPQWGNTRLWVDKANYLPGSAGLFCEGLEQVNETVDILGNVTVQNRCRFSLHWVVSDQADPQVMAQKLLDLQAWVQQQSALGAAPQMGQQTRWQARSGKKQEITHAMTVIYTVELTVQYQCKPHLPL